MYQQRFWKQFVLLRYRIEFYRAYLRLCVIISRSIKIFLKLTSTSSIAGWLIWTDLSILWAILIGLAQIIESIKTYLPFDKNVEPLKAIIKSLEGHFMDSELVWYSVAESKFTEEEIHSEMVKMKSISTETEEKILSNVDIPRYKWLINKAESDADLYFQNY